MKKKKIDYSILLVSLALTIFGLIALYSCTKGDPTLISIFKKQIIWSILGISLAIIALFIDTEYLYKYSYWIYILGIISLVFVLMHGRHIYGAKRWLNIGPFAIQPSEFAKIANILILARILSNVRFSEKDEIMQIIKAFFVTGLYTYLIFKEPDLGTSLVFIVSLFAILFASGIKWKYIFSLIAISVLSAPLLWFFLKDYQKFRILVFLNPELDPLKSGYNVIQSKIAIGSGGLWGNGLFKGAQSKLQFIPKQHTDFIFSVIGEELGFIGALILLGLYGILVYRALKIAYLTEDKFDLLLIIGIVAMISFHIFVNIGMTTGSLPATGLPLPFISFGGSFMITNWVSIGILLNIGSKLKVKKEDYEDKKENR